MRQGGREGGRRGGRRGGVWAERGARALLGDVCAGRGEGEVLLPPLRAQPA